MTQNPYTPTNEPTTPTDLRPPSPRRWATIGFLVACVPFVLLGGYGLYADAQYAATLPPNTPRCGNGAMGAMLLIFPVGPVLGCIGAVVGFVSAFVCDAVITGDQLRHKNHSGG